MIFILLILINLIGEYFNLNLLKYITKPFLMPMLFYLRCPTHNLIIIAIILSTIGDVLLLFKKKYMSFFIVGVVCFLFTQFCYILFFLTNYELQFSPYLILLIIFISCFIVPIIMANVDDITLQGIIMFYIIILSIMLYCSSFVNLYVFIGALLFVISDALIGLTLDGEDDPIISVGIMITYISAQYLIITWI